MRSVEKFDPLEGFLITSVQKGDPWEGTPKIEKFDPLEVFLVRSVQKGTPRYPKMVF